MKTQILILALLPFILCQDFQNAKYIAKDAGSKMDLLMDKCYADFTPHSWHSIRVAELFVEDMNTSFDRRGDDMPYQAPFKLELRPKVIHTVGSVAEVEYVSVGNHPYTGVFKGCDEAILRISLAKKPEPKVPNVAGGLAMKFMRDGVESGNIFAMYSLKGQSSFNMFENDFTNHVPMINMDKSSFAERQLVGAFKKASEWPTMIGLKPMAKWDQYGNEEKNINFPFRIIYHPTKAARAAMSSAPSNDEFYHVKAIDGFKTPVLYEIFAQATPE